MSFVIFDFPEGLNKEDRIEYMKTYLDTVPNIKAQYEKLQNQKEMLRIRFAERTTVVPSADSDLIAENDLNEEFDSSYN